MKDKNIILEGITGSVAYGLNTEDSDIDIKGVYLAPIEEVIGLRWNFEKTTIDHTNPDYVYHELQKFMHLAIKANPTITEMLWLDNYTKLTDVGKILVDNRELFLSNTVYKSYGGYALSQARKLNARGGTYGHGRANRYEKHTRHTFRLLYQAKELLETGSLTVKVSPAVRKELFDIGKQSPEYILDKFENDFKALKEVNSVLPDKPDEEAVNKLLLKIRGME